MKWLFLLLLPGLVQAQSTSLKEQIQHYLSGRKGTYAVAYKNLATGEHVYINENDSFHAASTMKTPVMLEVYRQAYKGKFSVLDSIVVKNEFKSIVDGSPYSLVATDDSEPKLYEKVGQKRTIYDLMYEMIIYSSNLATNIIIDLVDARNVTKTLCKMGAKHTQVLRGVEDKKAFAQGLNNKVSAYDLALLFEKIAKGKAVSPEASQAMISILLDQKFNSVIPAKLPKSVKVAHKTGSIVSIMHDSGIVYLPDGRKYVLVLLSKNWQEPDREAAVETMATVSEMIYQSIQ
ncbi:serine hydrolase [Siphonobacter sp. BAB-5385]|uniref:serine hydrolase n=1 Tax=unclassified Siphonobacter TaxID=2635712 RepID=UPI000B9EE621|nr:MULTISPECIES: serine hydrolase [unclassified Siphonobacter]OZI05807.1 serine hydrolase [Siphonobacter sp. BAB-5385]PMD90454.1 serine hydrolase [Siphonobacter sp. BAB-5405]